MACRICGGTEQRLKATVKGARYVQCTCGVTFADPLPTEEYLEEFYDRNYTKDMGIGSENPHFTEEYKPVYWSEKVMTFRDMGFPYEDGGGRSWLDVGCANGLFVEWIRQFGYSTKGTDVSREMVEEARKKGLDCRSCSSPDELGEAFDVVSLWDAIEHLPEPRAFIESVRKCVKKGGSLLLQTPCTGIISDKFGDSWREYTYPNHIHLFSQESLFRLLADHGFAIRNWVRFGSGNTGGTLPEERKRVFDGISKQLGIGDQIALWAIML